MDEWRNWGDAMVAMYLYVEGGGDDDLLYNACRRGFTEFLIKSGLKGHMPRIVACGGRRDAYDRFCTKLRQGQAAMLLVDSEEFVDPQYCQGEPEQWQPWRHLAQRKGDEWAQPAGATDGQCHLMVHCMESWFLSDPDALKTFFGQGYDANKLPSRANAVESVAKPVVYQALAEATRHCKTKAPYGKGEHSFLLLARIDPAKVAAASPWADRFVTILKKAMAC